MAETKTRYNGTKNFIVIFSLLAFSAHFSLKVFPSPTEMLVAELSTLNKTQHTESSIIENKKPLRKLVELKTDPN